MPRPTDGRGTGHVSRGLVACLATFLLGGTATGCGSPAEPAATSAAVGFYAALADDDGAAACAALSPRAVAELEQSARKPCAEAVLEERIPDVGEPVDSSVYGNLAQVRFSGETAFLSRFDDGWRLTAAGCVPAPHQRYDCLVSGG